MNKQDIKLYIVSHSEDEIKKIRNDELYTPLFVGRNGKNNFGFCSDDSFDGNISNKNKDYCELTGLYWIWKASNANIVGLCHYRRYFKSDSGKLIEKKDIINYLNNYDIILPIKTELIKESYWETYKNHHLGKALKITDNIIKNRSPEYYKTFKKTLSQSSFSNYNMFICQKNIIDNYCEWVFPILSEIEEKIDVNEFPRVFGLISEAIFNVWIEHNQLKIKECNVYYLGNKLKFRMFLINNSFFRNMYKFLYFKLMKNKIGAYLEKVINTIFY